MSCKAKNCKSSIIARGCCDKHYRRLKKYGSLDLPQKTVNSDFLCSVGGCKKTAKTKKLCVAHYALFLKWGTTKGVRKYRDKKSCLFCENIYSPINNTQKYCSRDCYTDWIKNNKHKPVVMDRNYRMLYIPNNLMANKKGYVYEHRFIMSDSLGRPLASDEIVHHINEIQDDNRIENLILTTRQEHMSYHKALFENLSKTKHITKEELQNKYHSQNMTIQELAKEYHCSMTSISNLLRKFNLRKGRGLNQFTYSCKL